MKKIKTEETLKKRILEFVKENKNSGIYEISSGLNLDMRLVTKLCNELMIEGKMEHPEVEDNPEEDI